jgi:hypothetical protein
MKIEVNISKKYFSVLLGVVIVLGISAGVIAVWDDAKTLWHTGDDVKVNVGGVDYSLQEAIDQGDVLSDCVIKRSAPGTGDKVAWCPANYEKIIHCSVSDADAPDGGPTQMTECLSDGDCSATGDLLRGSLGGELVYLELVENSDTGVQGCWGYDYEHNHVSYRIEMVCCN